MKEMKAARGSSGASKKPSDVSSSLKPRVVSNSKPVVAESTI
jgi:hypothetical protein